MSGVAITHEFARAVAVQLAEFGWCVNESGMFDEPPDDRTITQIREALEKAAEGGSLEG